MKKIIVALYGIVTLISCATKREINYALFSGSIQNTDVIDFKISGDDFSKEISLNEDGSFSDTLAINEKGYFSIKIGKQSAQAFFSKGDNINVTVDDKDFSNSITFFGEGANVNNYLAEKARLSKKLTGDINTFYGLDENEFVSNVNDIEVEMQNLLAKADLPEDFITSEKKNIYFEKVSNLQNYARFHGMISKNIDFKVSENFPNELDKIDFTNITDYKNSSHLKMLMIEYYMRKYMEAYETTNDFSLALKETLKDVPNSQIKDKFLLHTSSFAMGPNESLKDIYDYYMENTIDESIKEGYTKKYDNLKTLAKGTPSPTFTYENYAGGTTSLEDLRGKLVYIDVWATWCGPCKREIPFLKEVEKQFHNKNIAFVSISVDKKKDYEVWRKMIKEQNLEGIQLIADNDRNSKWYKEYKIIGIPRFILIDTEGNIISADAPRPSNPNLVKKLNKLLEY